MTAWVVRGGAAGEYEQFAQDNYCAAVDWDVPDLTACRTRDDVQRLVDSSSPGDSTHRRAAVVGQLWAIRQGIQPGDMVVMPLKSKPGYLLMGECSGGYRFNGGTDGSPRHAVGVSWGE